MGLFPSNAPTLDFRRVKLAESNPTSPDGNLVTTAVEVSGQPMLDEMRQAIKLIIKRETSDIDFGEIVDRGTVKSDSADEPRRPISLGARSRTLGR